MHSYLIGIAFQRLSMCFATKMHLYFASACNILNTEPPRILSVRVRLEAYIDEAMFKALTFHTHRAVARHVQYDYFCRRDKTVFIFLFSIVC